MYDERRQLFKFESHVIDNALRRKPGQDFGGPVDSRNAVFKSFTSARRFSLRRSYEYSSRFGRDVRYHLDFNEYFQMTPWKWYLLIDVVANLIAAIRFLLSRKRQKAITEVLNGVPVEFQPLMFGLSLLASALFAPIILIYFTIYGRE